MLEKVIEVVRVEKFEEEMRGDYIRTIREKLGEVMGSEVEGEGN